jgi:hypothetical protein
MSDDRIIMTGNMKTIIVVTFVLAILAVIFNLVNYQRTNNVMAIVTTGNNINMQTLVDRLATNQAATGALEAKITALEKRIAANEATIKAAAAAPLVVPAAR